MTDFERQLMWALQALAQPAFVQPTLFPSFVFLHSSWSRMSLLWNLISGEK